MSSVLPEPVEGRTLAKLSPSKPALSSAIAEVEGSQPNHRRALGALGERMAVHHLESKGYTIIERNHRTLEGEIDIIARTGDTLAFVEVKSRRGHSMGYAVESLTPAKQRRMVALAEAYLPDREDLPPGRRVDLIAIDFAPDGRLLSLVHHENALTAD